MKIAKAATLVVSLSIVTGGAMLGVYRFDNYLRNRFDHWARDLSEHIDYRYYTQPIVEQDI
jgi:hypothetical protein